jgi:hypothetical protein
MADLYTASAGTLITSRVSSPAFISADALDDLLDGGFMMATSFRIDRGQDVQILKTLSNLYYVYAFGEAPGKILIGGLLFFSDCTDPSGQSDIIEQLNSYFDQNNIYDLNSPVTISIGGATYQALLTNLSVAADMTPYNYASFSLGFTLLPKDFSPP